MRRASWEIFETGAGPDRRMRLTVLVSLVLLQATSAMFFLGDVIADFMTIGMVPHTWYEAIATLALILGVLFGALETRRTMRRSEAAESALKMASGAFTELVGDRFGAWGLTESEQQVALLTLKGFNTPEIARLRGTAQGTVRAQLGSIYAKSETSGRGQFVALFIEELLDEPLLEKAAG